MTSAEALTSLQWVPLHARPFGHRCWLVQDAMKGEIPEHLDVFESTMTQQHGYNTHNGYLPVISKTRTEWGKNKTCYKEFFLFDKHSKSLRQVNLHSSR